MAMSKRKVVVKRLNAIQNFGAMDVLCTDKTGTLTLDKIVLERHVDLDGDESDDALEYGYTSTAFPDRPEEPDGQGGAHASRPRGADRLARFRVVDEIPFDFQRRRMSVVVSNGRWRTPADLQGRGRGNAAICAFRTHRRRHRADDVGERAPRSDQGMTHELNEDGLRVLVVAIKREPSHERPTAWPTKAGLTRSATWPFLDPPKDSAAHRHPRAAISTASR
jgi:Mg2+-importing ATPase